MSDEPENKKAPKRLKISKHLREFHQRARSVLWRLDPKDSGKEKYHAWEARIEELQKESGCQYGEAVIRASKEYPSLYRLFREYDVREFDPSPESHAMVRHFGESARASVTDGEEVDVVIQDQDLSYRDNLSWAMAAAGEFLRTKQNPGLCPNDSAWFLYVQAVEAPKEFMAKVGQIESKNDEGEGRRELIKGGRRSIRELDAMLDELSLEYEREIQDDKPKTTRNSETEAEESESED